MTFDHISALQAVKHTHQIKVLSLNPNCGIPVWVLLLLRCFLHLLFQILIAGMSQHPHIRIIKSVVSHSHILILHQFYCHLSHRLIMLVASSQHGLGGSLLHLHGRNSLFQEINESLNIILVSTQCRDISLFINLEIKPVLLNHLHWSLSRHCEQSLVDLSFASGESFELFTENDVVVFTAVFQELL